MVGTAVCEVSLDSLPRLQPVRNRGQDNQAILHDSPDCLVLVTS